MTKSSIIFLFLSLAVLVSCDDNSPTEVSAIPFLGQQFSSTIISLPVPPTNDAVPLMVVGQVQPKQWAIVRVNGKISLSDNPELTACKPDFDPPLSGRNAGPLGMPGAPDYLRVYLYRSGNNRGLSLSLDPDSSAAKTWPIYGAFATAENITAGRYGIYGHYYYPCFGKQVGYYSMSGSQTVTIEVLPDPKVTALETVVTSGDTVQFIASNRPEGMDPRWVYVAGDTLATPKMNPGWGQLPCTSDTGVTPV